jgi:hypothetical protein
MVIHSWLARNFIPNFFLAQPAHTRFLWHFYEQVVKKQASSVRLDKLKNGKV